MQFTPLVNKSKLYATKSAALAMALTLLCVMVGSPISRAENKLKIMTATTDMAALAQEVGGDKSR